MENGRNHIDINLKTNASRTKYLVSEPIYHTTKRFSEYLL